MSNYNNRYKKSNNNSDTTNYTQKQRFHYNAQKACDPNISSQARARHKGNAKRNLDKLIATERTSNGIYSAKSTVTTKANDYSSYTGVIIVE